MKKWFFVYAGLGVLILLSGPSLSKADKELREIVLTSRVEQGAKIWSPSKIFAKEGEKIQIRLENHTEVVHGFAIEELDIREQVFGGRDLEFMIEPGKKGSFRYYCFIHKAHKGGELIVE